jgi:hypothetical protein
VYAVPSLFAELAEPCWVAADDDARLLFRFIHTNGSFDVQRSHHLPAALYHSLVCQLIGTTTDATAAFKRLYARQAVIQGDRVFMVELRDEKTIRLTVKVDDARTAGSVLARVRPVVEDLAASYGVQWRAELADCGAPRCAGPVVLESARCTTCSTLCSAECDRW